MNIFFPTNAMAIYIYSIVVRILRAKHLEDVAVLLLRGKLRVVFHVATTHVDLYVAGVGVVRTLLELRRELFPVHNRNNNRSVPISC